MSHSWTYEAIVLQAYDVGEADRFLILLTRERGRLAARARAVRKMQSRLGGSLLPYQHITIGLTEGSAGMIVTSAQCHQQTSLLSSTKSFLLMQQGVEILLSLLHEEEPLPDIFELTLNFLQKCQKREIDTVLPFAITLLTLMGLFSDGTTAEEAAYIQQCTKGEWPLPPPTLQRSLEKQCSAIITEQTDKKFKVASIAASLSS